MLVSINRSLMTLILTVTLMTLILCPILSLVLSPVLSPVLSLILCPILSPILILVLTPVLAPVPLPVLSPTSVSLNKLRRQIRFLIPTIPPLRRMCKFIQRRKGDALSRLNRTVAAI